MKRILRNAFLANTIAICLAVGALAQEGNLIPGGAKPYTPSRLEWFAVELNAGYREPLTGGNRFSMDLVPVITAS